MAAMIISFVSFGVGMSAFRNHSRYRISRARSGRRIFQYKMIMKSNLFPIQNDHENGMSGVGVLRSDANTHAERRRTDGRADRGVLEGQRECQLRGPKPEGSVRVGP